MASCTWSIAENVQGAAVMAAIYRCPPPVGSVVRGLDPPLTPFPGEQVGRGGQLDLKPGPSPAPLVPPSFLERPRAGPGDHLLPPAALYRHLGGGGVQHPAAADGHRCS